MADDIDSGAASPAALNEGAAQPEATAPVEQSGQTDQQGAGQSAPESMAEALEKTVGGSPLFDNDSDGDEGSNESPTAPESYAAFTDAHGREFDAQGLGEFTAAAKELGLTQEGAQKMFGAMYPTMQGVFLREISERNEEWKKAAQTDKEYGGERFKANMAYAKKAYDRYCSPELKQVFAKTGLGNNPEIIRLMYRVGKDISQDPGVGGRSPEPQRTTSVLYPNTPGMKDD